MKTFPFVFVLALLAFSACNNTNEPPQSTLAKQQEPHPGATLFKQIPADQSGIDFTNTIEETAEMNPFVFFNVYNGGGIAVADFDNDGLPDVYFTGNQVANKLYHNLGGLKFTDITDQAGVAGSGSWTTGVTIVDINADGWLDLYVCQSGGEQASAEATRNLLFVNNQDLTFTEAAQEYGIADSARSNHATFFDYDGDGDLDLYVVNHPLGFGDHIDTRLSKAKNPGERETDKLFRNKGDGTFENVTDKAGLRNYGFGLSVSTADFNHDGWPDLYVANDYSEPDHHYQNNGDGTFTDVVHSSMGHISQFSMGSDAGDINNDGLTDLLVVDMMAEDNRRKKTNMQGMDREAFYRNFGYGRHLQYMQNMLQLNRDNGQFSEIAELAGMAYTDWSWAPLFCDLDNDGWKDVFISNGMRKDIRDNDFVKKLLKTPDEYTRQNFQQLLAQVPEEKIDNYVYRNNGNLQFSRKNSEWGLSFRGYSNGAMYADLDRDGDLELLINNIDDPAAVFENTAENSHFVQVKLNGPAQNPFGIGSKVQVRTGGTTQTAEMYCSHGFQSAAEPVLHFGLGTATNLDEVVVTWPDGKQSSVQTTGADSLVLISYADAQPAQKSELADATLLVESDMEIPFRHQELWYEDYDAEVLIPHRYSQLGPFSSVADVNGDGLDDVFIGGATNQSAQLFIQQKNGSFASTTNQAWQMHGAQEDMGCAFFDADNDGDMDLYVASGSNEWPAGSSDYQDRMYFNNGDGQFDDATGMLPVITSSGSCVRPADVDGDGDLDLFVGGRVVPGKYPFPASSLLLLNQGGRFVDVTATWAPQLQELGLVSDAVWADINNDKYPDLLVAGEWMPITVFSNTGNKLENKTAATGLEDKTGWWYSIAAADFDGDGDLDLMAGNLGLNSKYQTTEGPVEVYSGDLDHNGTNDIVLAYNQQGSCFPVRGKTCSSEQIPTVNTVMPTYEAFGVATVQDIYGQELSTALHLQANWLSTSYIENLGNGKFKMHTLPIETQFSAINRIIPHDINGDGNLDAVLAGNMWSAEIETVRHDANKGVVLLGDGSGNFSAAPASQAGYFSNGDVKDVQIFEGAKGHLHLLITRNHDLVRVFDFSESPNP